MKDGYKECLGQLHSAQASVQEDALYCRSKDTLPRSRGQTSHGQSTNMMGSGTPRASIDTDRSGFPGQCPLCRQEKRPDHDKVISLVDLRELKELREQNLLLIDSNKQLESAIQNLDEKCQNLEENNEQLLGKLKFAMTHAQDLQAEFLRQQDAMSHATAQFRSQQEEMVTRVQHLQRELADQVS